jgi:hypothetical protein
VVISNAVNYSICLTDVNGDNYNDIVVSGLFEGGMSVLINKNKVPLLKPGFIYMVG